MMPQQELNISNNRRDSIQSDDMSDSAKQQQQQQQQQSQQAQQQPQVQQQPNHPLSTSSSSTITPGWGIWGTGRSPFGSIDESPFENGSGSVHDGWINNRRNSTFTDPNVSHQHMQQQQQQQQQQNPYSVFRSSSFSGQQQQHPIYGSSPTYKSFRQSAANAPPFPLPPQGGATSPRFFPQQPQTNILERFSQVAEATREAELLNNSLQNLNLDQQNSVQPMNVPMPPPQYQQQQQQQQHSELNSPSTSYRSENKSPYLSPTPIYTALDYQQKSNQQSRSNSMTSVWKPNGDDLRMYHEQFQQQPQQQPQQQQPAVFMEGEYDAIQSEHLQRQFMQKRTPPPPNVFPLQQPPVPIPPPPPHPQAMSNTPPVRSNSRGSIGSQSAAAAAGIFPMTPVQQPTTNAAAPVPIPVPVPPPQASGNVQQQQKQQYNHVRYPSRGGGGGGGGSSGSTSASTGQSPQSQAPPPLGFTRDGLRSPFEQPQQPPPIDSRVSPPASNSRYHNHREKDMVNMRSPLLEDFRSNKNNKKYELSDLYGHIVEFSGDQHGSRFIQQRLESASSEEKEIIFNEIRSNSLQLMTDVFGNYVIQKFFELGNQMQKTILAKQMEGHILNLSLQMYGCRVVQKAIEHVLTDQQATLVKELDGHVLKCVKDQNGNHVIQKAIERVPGEHIGFILESFNNQVYQLATHPYGCRVIQRMLEHSDNESQRKLLNELHSYTQYLVEDQYGNYVVQHVVQRGHPSDRERIINIVRETILSFSRHKYASNVVEKCIMCGSSKQRTEMIDEILRQRSDGSMPITVMMRDQFANYVIQKLLEVTEGADHARLVAAIKPQLQALKKYSYGKHLISIEKLLNATSTATTD